MAHIATCSRCSVSKRIIACYPDNTAIKVCDDCYTTNSNDLVRYFEIPSDNMGELARRFTKLGKRAKKLKLPEPTFRELGTERRVKKNDITGLTEKVYLLHQIVVDPGTTEVKVSGWTFVATIQHTEEGNIIRKVGENEIPNKYRQVSNLCEHCNTNRYRKDTYILLHENGETKQVGRNCLADFFGHDALMYAERAQYLADIGDISDSMEDEMGFGGGGGPRYNALEEFLSHVAQCISLEGWMSRGRAKQMEGYVQATADIAYLHMTPAARPPRWVPLYSTPDPKSIELANQSIEWASEIEGEEIPDYLHNIRVIARRGVCEGRDQGLAASIVSAYQRHLNQLRRKELAAKRAETASYVGIVGQRGRFALHVEDVKTCESDFGTSYLHSMVDSEGNVYKWFSSSTTLEANTDYILNGTIKKHDEWKGLKQNMLSRCEVVELKNYFCFIDGEKRMVYQVASELEARKALRTELNVKKLPRNTVLIEDVAEKEGAV